MISISLCMIVKNEEKVLGRCLESICHAVDEIIIVDTGSTDKTKQIAARFTQNIYDFDWINDFSAARNFAFSKATMDYQMWLDADDVLPQAECSKLIALKNELPPGVDMVTMKYHTHFDGQGNPVFTSTRERLLRREQNFHWTEPVHECIPLRGSIHNADIAVHHLKPPGEGTSQRNLKIYEDLAAGGGQLSPRQQYYFARELKDHGFYARAADYFKGFLNGGQGWLEDNIAACYNLAQCYGALNKTQQVLPALLQSFRYDSPRAEICCQVGYYYKGQGDYLRALNWFATAAALPKGDSLGFVLQDYRGYIPHIELAVCYYTLGNLEKAILHNELAGQYKPDNPSVVSNRIFFSSIQPA